MAGSPCDRHSLRRSGWPATASSLARRAACGARWLKRSCASPRRQRRTSSRMAAPIARVRRSASPSLPTPWRPWERRGQICSMRGSWDAASPRTSCRRGALLPKRTSTYETIVREPLSFAYSGSTVHTNGPPSAGGPTLAQMMRVITAYDLASIPDADYAKILAGAMKYALEDRERAYTEITENARVAERLMGEEYVRGQRARILGSGSTLGDAFGSPHTTHLSCVDASGLAVSITASMGYGSGIVIPGTGIPMGNTLGEPELNPKGFHALTAGERLISSMSPTVVSSPDGDIVSLGSPGASRIPTAILQTLVNVVVFGLSLEAAVRAPRLHAEGDLFAYETGARKPVLSAYERVLAYDEPSMFFGGVNAARRTPEGVFEAAADPRRAGGVAFA